MQTTTRVFFWISQLTAAALLSAGYLLAGLWWILFPAVPIGFAGGFAHRYGWPWLSSTVLVVTLFLAAGGILLGVSPHWLVAAAAASLAAWELAPGGAEGSPTSGSPGKNSRLVLLAVSVLPGLLIAEIGLALRIAIPFGVLVLAALLVLFGLYWFYRMMNREKKE